MHTLDTTHPKQKMASSSKKASRRTPSLPWTVRIKAAVLAAAHRLDGSIRRPVVFLGDLKAGATPSTNNTSDV
jgi:hypothetical protein